MAESTSKSTNNFGAGIQFYIEEGIKNDVKQVVESIKGVEVAATESQDAVEGVGDAITQAKNALETLNQYGQGMVSWGHEVLGVIRGWGEDLINHGNTLEQTRRQFELVYHDSDRAARAIRSAQDVAATTNLDTAGVLQQVVSYQRLGVDALRTYNSQWTENGQIVHGQVANLQLIADLINGSGQASENVYYQLRNALRGQSISFQALFDGVQTQQETHAFKSARTAQERMDAIANTISRVYGGISKSTENTFGFISANISDVVNVFKATIGEKIVPALAPLAQRLFRFLDALGRDTELIEAIADGFKMIASVVGFFLDKALLAANFFREFVKAHPFVIKFGLVMASVSAILAIVVGTLMTAIAAIGGFLLIVIPAITMAVPALIGAFSTLATIIAPVSLVLAKIAGMATVIYTAYENNFGGVRTFVQQVADAFTGLYEVIVNWSNGTTEMSEETYASLQDAGVAEFIIGLGGYIAAMIDVVKQVGQQIRDNLGYIWSPIKKTVKEVFEAIGKTFEVFWSAFQVIFGGVSENFDGTRRQVVGVKEVMHGLGVVVTGALLKIQGIAFAVKVALDYISPVLHFIGRVIRAVVDIVRGSIKGIGDAIDAVKPQFTIAITQISGAFTRLWNTIKPIWDRIKTTLAPVIERVVNAISPLVAKIRSFFGDSHTGAVTSTRRFNVFGETVRIVSSALIKAFTVVGTIFRVLAVVIDIGVYIFQRLAKEAGLAWIWIKKKADEFVKWVKPVLDDFRFFAEWVWKRISGNAEDYWRKANVIWNDIKHIAGVAWDFISSKAQAFYQFIRPLLDGIAYVAGIVWYFISSTAVAAWTAIKKAFSETAASIRGSSVYKWLQEKWGAIKSFIIGVWDSVSSKMHWLYGEIRSVVTSIGSGIRRVFEGVFNFIDHKIQWILQKFRGFRDSISEFLGPIARAVGLTPSPTTATNTSQIDETAVIGRAIMETSWDQSSTPAPSGSFRTPDRGIDIMDTSGDVKTEESPRAAQALKEVASTNAQLMNTLPNAIRQAVADGLSENNSRSMSPDR